jgi:hypothetical protein
LACLFRFCAAKLRRLFHSTKFFCRFFQKNEKTDLIPDSRRPPTRCEQATSGLKASAPALLTDDGADV